MQNEDINAAIATLQAATDAARLRYPQLGASFGYIGNCERWGDDRSWRVFTKLSTQPSANGINISWGRVDTVDLPGIATPEALSRLEAWLAETAAKLEARKLYQVGPENWLKAEIERARASAASIVP